MPVFAQVIRLSLVLAFVGATTLASAQDDQTSRIAAMNGADLGKFVDTVTATVGQDSLRMQAAASSRDCLELIRIANSFDLGYAYLAAARAAPPAAGKDDESLGLRLRIVQARVLTFAARMRAGEWLKACGGFVVPEDKRGDPRYQQPRPVAAGEFGDAVADAHEGALANLAAAAKAFKTTDCRGISSAGEAITLYAPYLDKLSADLAARPEVLGPRVSRRLIDGDRSQLAAAEQSLWQRFNLSCKGAITDAPADGHQAVPTPQ